MYNELREVNQEDRPDLKISGSGSAGGGSYNKVKISGSGQVNGHIECNELHTSGASMINGNVRAREIITSGSSKVSGNVETELIKTSGSSKIGGDVLANEVKSSGSTKIEGNLKTVEIGVSGNAHIGGNVNAETVKISGTVDIGGDCQSEKFNANGAFRIGGLLNGDDIEIQVYGSCRAREIGGEKIRVRQNPRDIFGIDRILKAIFMNKGELSVDTIEGDDIQLEVTRAKVVRGNNITIGEGCDIETVEYTGTLNIVEGGIVKEQRKIE
jgi:cytoskeletal protein CcmA (bactofilin family)